MGHKRSRGALFVDGNPPLRHGAGELIDRDGEIAQRPRGGMRNASALTKASAFRRSIQVSDLLRLPAADRAHIDSKKLRDYLLSDEHPQGRYKAAFFGMIGYTRQDWQRLKIDLLQIAQGGVAFPGKISDFGQKYQVNGMLRGPSGRPAWVTTVWIVKNSDDFPTLVTVFPGENP